MISAAALLCAAPALADGYYFAGASQDATFYVVDTDTIKDLSPGKKSVQIIASRNGDGYDGDIKYSINTTYFDCAKPAYAEPLRVFYDASGAVIRQLDHTADAPYYRPILPNTLADAQLKAVCTTDTATIAKGSLHFDDIAGLVKSLDDYYAAHQSGSAH